MPRPSASGFSLIEVFIATAITVIMMAAVIEAMAGTQRIAILAEAQDDLTSEGDRALDFIAADLAAAGWHFPDGATPTPTGASYTSKTWDRSLLYYPYVQLQATNASLTGSLGSRFQHTWRPSATAGLAFPPDLAEVLPGSPADNQTLFGLASRNAYMASFFARSQELIFVKATTSVWDHVQDRPTSKQDEQPTLRFPGSRRDWATEATSPIQEETKRARLRILYSSASAPIYTGTDITGFSNRNVYGYVTDPNGTVIGQTDKIPYGVVMESGWMKDIKGDLSAIGVNWQTLDGNGYTSTAQGGTNIREYMYAVVPSRYGFGRLVRAKQVTVSGTPSLPGFPEVGDLVSFSGTDGMRIDQVLSDNVMRVVFDTYRTVDEVASPPASYRVTSLDINNVRVRLYMAKRMGKGQGEVINRVAERAVTMRARNSALDKDFEATDSSASYLGRSPIGLDF